MSRHSLRFTDPNCPLGYKDLVKDSDYCYKISNTKANWQQAFDLCQEDKGFLAHVYSDKEQKAIVDYATSILEDVHVYLGANQTDPNKEVYKWQPEGTSLTYSNWKRTEPNYPDELCLVVLIVPRHSYNGLWLDVSCSKENHFMCMKEREGEYIFCEFKRFFIWLSKYFYSKQMFL